MASKHLGNISGELRDLTCFRCVCFLFIFFQAFSIFIHDDCSFFAFRPRDQCSDLIPLPEDDKQDTNLKFKRKPRKDSVIGSSSSKKPKLSTATATLSQETDFNPDNPKVFLISDEEKESDQMAQEKPVHDKAAPDPPSYIMSTRAGTQFGSDVPETLKLEIKSKCSANGKSSSLSARYVSAKSSSSPPEQQPLAVNDLPGRDLQADIQNIVDQNSKDDISRVCDGLVAKAADTVRTFKETFLAKLSVVNEKRQKDAEEVLKMEMSQTKKTLTDICTRTCAELKDNIVGPAKEMTAFEQHMPGIVDAHEKS